MFMSKSEFAFRMSAQKFFDEQRHVYFWTFTCKQVHPDWYYSQIWSRFFREIQNLYGGTVQGLKVVELHDNHGIHWHTLLNIRVGVQQVRRIAKRYGIGRVHAKKADLGSIGYLAKYISSDLRKTGKELHARVARWQCIGHFVGVRKCNVEISGTAFIDRVRFAQEFLGVKQIPWHLYDYFRQFPANDRLQDRRYLRSLKGKFWRDHERIDMCEGKPRALARPKPEPSLL
ncbi:MAG TPA: hypothetical protein VEH27_11040 [Methylomirabilota bacterium]|nr:hypothetical protein [Methylomirabilota bacterium]